jgi:hypothetical protein
MNSLIRNYSYEILVIAFILTVVAAIAYDVATGNFKENGCREGQYSISGYSGGHYTHLCVDQGTQAPVILDGQE